MAILCTQNKWLQIKLVLNFSILLYCGVSQILLESALEMHSHFLWDSIFETGKRRSDRSISDCTNAMGEGFAIIHKILETNSSFHMK